MKSKPLFTNRFVAFVDILGFQEIVQRMETTPELFDTVRHALRTIRDQSNAFGEYRAEKREVSKKRAARGKESSRPTDIAMTAFSDCYVVSESEDVWRVLAGVQALGTRLLSQGILCRGGIVRGPAYHRNDILFGQAIVDAYKLERDVAKYPRILVTEAVRKAGWYYHEGRWKEQLFTQDHDGCWFLNLLTPSFSQWKPISNEETSSRELLRKVRTPLLQSIKNSGNDLNLLSKFHWLGNHFNVAAKKVGNVDLIEFPSKGDGGSDDPE
jgi:hypothetical protein